MKEEGEWKKEKRTKMKTETYGVHRTRHIVSRHWFSYFFAWDPRHLACMRSRQEQSYDSPRFRVILTQECFMRYEVVVLLESIDFVTQSVFNLTNRSTNWTIVWTAR